MVMPCPPYVANVASMTCVDLPEQRHESRRDADDVHEQAGHAEGEDGGGVSRAAAPQIHGLQEVALAVLQLLATEEQ